MASRKIPDAVQTLSASRVSQSLDPLVELIVPPRIEANDEVSPSLDKVGFTNAVVSTQFDHAGYPQAISLPITKSSQIARDGRVAGGLMP